MPSASEGELVDDLVVLALGVAEREAGVDLKGPDYRQLARWLPRSTPPHPGRLCEIERARRELGRELPRDRTGSPSEAMGRTLTALGFARQRQPGEMGRVVYRLSSCPYREAVREDQPMVCTLCRGLSPGVLDELEPSGLPPKFVPEDPDRAGCLIEAESFDRATSSAS